MSRVRTPSPAPLSSFVPGVRGRPRPGRRRRTGLRKRDHRPGPLAARPAIIRAMDDPKTRRRLVLGARMMLVMLFVAALAILGLGLAVALLADPPETSGWLRHLFGRVFAVVAVGMAAVLGIPGAIGLWAMAGARDEGATPVMSPTVRLVATALAIAAIVAAVVLGIVTGSGLTLLDLGLIGIVVLASL